MSSEIFEQAAHDVVSVLPNRVNDIARLKTLLNDSEPIVTVIGKYNHGKSRLLNESIGQNTFAVADKRETVKLSASVHQGVRWLDAPGLDADVGTEDDRQALHAAWLKSDIRLFVHAAKEGELDAKELALLAELCADGDRTERQTLFVLSQVDQLADDVELQKVSIAIGAQAPGIALNAVSSTRHRKGLEDGKKLLLEKSGIPLLRCALDAALARVPTTRAHETALLFGEIRKELEQLRTGQEKSLEVLRQTQRQQRLAFSQGLKTVIDKVSGEIDVMLNALGADNAVVPDSARDAYAITAGKLERAYIQIAYSRACIEIDGFLAGHGVIGLERRREMRVNRAQIKDNPATIIFIHMAQSGLGRKECPVYMNRRHFSPVAVRELLDRSDNLNPGVRDQDAREKRQQIDAPSRCGYRAAQWTLAVVSF